MSYTTKFTLKTNKSNLIMSSALLVTYVLRIVFPKVLEHHIGDCLAYYINNYIITDMVMVVIKFRVVCRSFINTVYIKNQ